MKLPKQTEKPQIFSYKKHCLRERDSNQIGRFDVQSHWWHRHRTWLITPVCRAAHGARGLLIDFRQLHLCEGDHVPQQHCTFRLEYCCVDHQVKKTVPGLHSYTISSAVVLAEQRALREILVGVTIHIFTCHMVPCGGEFPPAGLVNSHVYGI